MEKVIYQHKVDYIVVRMSSEHEKQERFATVFWQLLGTIWGKMDKNCKIVEYDYEIRSDIGCICVGFCEEAVD